MADIRKQQRAGAMLALATATGGLLAAAMASSPVARADDPFADIASYVQTSITTGETDYSDAAADFATAGGTNAGLAAEFAGFDNTFISSADYVLLGLAAAGTGTDYSIYGGIFNLESSTFPLTAAGEQADVAPFLSTASSYFSEATTALSGGEFFAATYDSLLGGYYDVLAGQAETLAALFSLGI
jgi:hypothetical protein